MGVALRTLVRLAGCRSFPAALCGAVLLSAGAVDAAPPLPTVTDSTGRVVQIPSQVNRIADGWYAHNELVIMLGAADKIAVTVMSPESGPWMYRIFPELSRAESSRGARFNAEELFAQKVDLAFLVPGDSNIQELAKFGIPALAVTFTDFASMRDCISTTAQVLGSEAMNRAARFLAYLDNRYASVTRITRALPEATLPRVVHLVGINPLRVDGGHTIIDEWIRAAGGRNVAADIAGNMKEISLEQLLFWDPDYIILGAAAARQFDRNDPRWRALRAIGADHVLTNPAGVFAWDRYGVETALQIQWAAKQFHPAEFTAVDMRHEVREFYAEFFNYKLTEDDITRILQGSRPGER